MLDWWYEINKWNDIEIKDNKTSFKLFKLFLNKNNKDNKEQWNMDFDLFEFSKFVLWFK